MCRPYLKSKSGFTLIELLIVIALLGALAIGLIGALDPLEQFKKGEDAVMQDVVSQYWGASIRYRAATKAWPWDATAHQSFTLNDFVATDPAGGITQKLIDGGELKKAFRTNYDSGKLSNVILTYEKATDSVSLCFMPNSKSIRTSKDTLYTSSGVLLSGCPVGGSSTDCHWCVRQ